MNKKDARNYVRSNIAEAFTLGCRHHINNTTNNEYKKFLIEQIAELNKRLKDSGWSTFDVPAYTPIAPEGGREPTANEQKILEAIEKSTKILDDMHDVTAEIHIMRKLDWETGINKISRAINAFENKHKSLLVLTKPSEDERKKELEPLATNIISAVNELKEEDAYKNVLLKLEQDVREFRMIIEYLKRSGAMGSFPRLNFLNNWEVFFFNNWDEKINKLSEINGRLRGVKIAQAKDNVLNHMKNTVIKSLGNDAQTTTNIEDLHKVFSNTPYIDKKGNLNLGDLKKKIASGSYNNSDLLETKTFEIYQFQQAIIHIDEEFKITKDLEATIKSVNKLLKTRLS